MTIPNPPSDEGDERRHAVGREASDYRSQMPIIRAGAGAEEGSARASSIVAATTPAAAAAAAATTTTPPMTISAKAFLKPQPPRASVTAAAAGVASATLSSLSTSLFQSSQSSESLQSSSSNDSSSSTASDLGILPALGSKILMQRKLTRESSMSAHAFPHHSPHDSGALLLPSQSELDDIQQRISTLWRSGHPIHIDILSPTTPKQPAPLLLLAENQSQSRVSELKPEDNGDAVTTSSSLPSSSSHASTASLPSDSPHTVPWKLLERWTLLFTPSPSSSSSSSSSASSPSSSLSSSPVAESQTARTLIPWSSRGTQPSPSSQRSPAKSNESLDLETLIKLLDQYLSTSPHLERVEYRISGVDHEPFEGTAAVQRHSFPALKTDTGTVFMSVLSFPPEDSVSKNIPPFAAREASKRLVMSPSQRQLNLQARPKLDTHQAKSLFHRKTGLPLASSPDPRLPSDDRDFAFPIPARPSPSAPAATVSQQQQPVPERSRTSPLRQPLASATPTSPLSPPRGSASSAPIDIRPGARHTAGSASTPPHGGTQDRLLDELTSAPWHEEGAHFSPGNGAGGMLGVVSISPPRHAFPSSASRRASLPSPSALPHKTLVGSFEESILHGRMSTAVPQSVSGFSADLNVSGDGRFSSRVTIPFQPVFYILPGEETPTPYVANIDLAHRENAAKLPTLIKCPPSGMVQLAVFNPQKTIVKVFLVRYDLSDMPPRTKTFIRQRTLDENVRDAGTLRYLIQLRFLCVKRSVYLYNSIRLVFSHRSPDSSTGIRVVTDGPTAPKYAALTPAERAELQSVSSRSRESSVDANDGDGDGDGDTASIMSL